MLTRLLKKYFQDILNRQRRRGDRDGFSEPPADEQSAPDIAKKTDEYGTPQSTSREEPATAATATRMVAHFKVRLTMNKLQFI